uniref:PID domain-containing protein n=1 Tax=Amphiprion percula TaxID=161767 RepID=A0A3P8TWX5_AMPPE
GGGVLHRVECSSACSAEHLSAASFSALVHRSQVPHVVLSLDWRWDSSSEAGSADDLDDPSLPPSADSLDKTSLGESVLSPLDMRDILIPLDVKHRELVVDIAEPVQYAEVELEEEDEAVEVEVRADGLEGEEEDQEEVTFRETETNISEEVEVANRRSNDEDHSRIHTLLSQIQLMGEEPHPSHQTPPHGHYSKLSELEACAASLLTGDGTKTTGLVFSESHQRDLLGLLQCTEMGTTPGPTCLPHRGEVDAVVSVSYSQEDTQRFWGHYGHHEQQRHRYPEPVVMKPGEEPPEREAAAESEQNADEQPSYKNVPGPCDPEELLDGVIFGATYLGSTQIKSEKNPWTNARMAQAQEAVDRIKAPEGESQPMTEVDLFISTQRIKVLTADTQVLSAHHLNLVFSVKYMPLMSLYSKEMSQFSFSFYLLKYNYFFFYPFAHFKSHILCNLAYSQVNNLHIPEHCKYFFSVLLLEYLLWIYHTC